eukprot:COSAG06_NODE_57114_length_281_cov_1.170330_1_plen_57_part_10
MALLLPPLVLAALLPAAADGMAATAVLAHATQKILQHEAAPAGGPTPLALMVARNEY